MNVTNLNFALGGIALIIFGWAWGYGSGYWAGLTINKRCKDTCPIYKENAFRG